MEEKKKMNLDEMKKAKMPLSFFIHPHDSDNHTKWKCNTRQNEIDTPGRMKSFSTWCSFSLSSFLM